MNIKAFSRLRTGLSVAFVLSVLVVFAGATVRATGSGMGCPDWPLCYGCWIPPVSVDQLPSDYAERYAVSGNPAQFDAVKTWIEYVNRLLGVAAGLALLVTAGLSVPVVRRRPSLGVLAVLSLLTVAFVAWLGARVVDSYLAAHAVTIHLLAAYLLLAFILLQREIADRVVSGPRPQPSKVVRWALVAVGVAFVVQWVLGIRTREEVEAWIWSQDLARTWWDRWAGAYDLHKVSAFVVGVATAVLVFFAARERKVQRRAWLLAFVCGVFVVAQAAVGLILWVGQLPSWAKPLHLLLATSAWSAWLALVFHSVSSRRTSSV